MQGRREIKLNADTSLIKLIAMASMLIDHLGSALFPGQEWMRIVGRIAFPIYAYCIAVGVNYTRNAGKYALRLAVVALISQPFYALGMRHVSPEMAALVVNPMPIGHMLRWYLLSFSHASNILVALLMGVLLLWSVRDKKYAATGLMVLAIGLMESPLRYSYGWKGIALMVIFYVFLDRPALSLLWTAGFMLWWGCGRGGSYHVLGLSFGLQTFALLALPFIYLPTNTGIKLPKWLFYLFYPAHLAAIYLAGIL